MLLRFAILALLSAAAVVQGQTEQADRLGLIGKEPSKEFIGNVIDLKYQVGNNTKRINTLKTVIATNTAETATLQKIANANNQTIQEQFSLLRDLNSLYDIVIAIFQNISDQLNDQLITSVSETIANVQSIVSGLNNLGRRLQANDEGRLISPIAIETAKKCSEELAKLATLILNNNATLYELQNIYNNTNEVNIAILQNTVEENEDNIEIIVNSIAEFRAFLEEDIIQLIERTLLNLTVIPITSELPSIQAINNLLNVSSTAVKGVVPASGGTLQAGTLISSCEPGKSLLGGSCYLDLPDGVTLAGISPYIKDVQGGATTFASLSFPMIPDYANDQIICNLTVTAASAATPTTAYWEDAPFPLTFISEALCYDDV